MTVSWFVVCAIYTVNVWFVDFRILTTGGVAQWLELSVGIVIRRPWIRSPGGVGWSTVFFCPSEATLVQTCLYLNPPFVWARDIANIHLVQKSRPHNRWFGHTINTVYGRLTRLSGKNTHTKRHMHISWNYGKNVRYTNWHSHWHS